MSAQLEKLKRFHEQCVGVREQMADLAVLCYMSADCRPRKRGTKYWYLPQLAIFNAERNMDREKHVREENKRIEVLNRWAEMAYRASRRERDENSYESEFSHGHDLDSNVYVNQESNVANDEAKCPSPIDLLDSDVEDDCIHHLY